MDKFKFQTKEIIATIIGVAVIVIAKWAEVMLVANGTVPAWVFDWARIRVLVVAIIAVFFGPTCGLLCGVGCNMLINVIFESSIIYPEAFVLGVYGLIVGLYYGKTHYDSKHFGIKDFFVFNAVQIMATIVCALFFVPLLRFLTEGSDVFNEVSAGAKRSLGNAVIIGIVCPFIMLMVKCVRRNGREQDRSIDTML